MVETYNKYITDGIRNGNIKMLVVNGVVVYKVRAPKSDEVVDGYSSIGSIGEGQTETEKARTNK